MAMDDELVTVMLVGGADRETQSIVERELAAAGITCFMKGSVVYTVQIRSPDAARAREILMESSALKDHWVQFPSD